MTQAGFIHACLWTAMLAPLLSAAVLAAMGLVSAARARRRQPGLAGGRITWGALSAAEARQLRAERAEDPNRDAKHDTEVQSAHGRIVLPLPAMFATIAIGIALLASLIALVVWSASPTALRVAIERGEGAAALTWLRLSPDYAVQLRMHIDGVTLAMFLMVTACAACIHIFSAGYLRGDRGLLRYFAALGLFCSAMLGLVASADLLMVFVFWELVGACSYLLIGYWFERRPAGHAALKAFIVNRIGDAGLLVGIALCWSYLGVTAWTDAAPVFQAGAMFSAQPGETEVPAAAAQRAAGLFQLGWLGISLATWLGLALLCGVIGKSAQFPLHVWLPDAMVGPTPVSALIHAATMVAAGVYLLARVFPLLTPDAAQVAAWLGCITLTGAAVLALFQTDIKRLLAYSTLSQLGYMVLGIGLGAWTGALFHLLTHAFFKALLFLGAGQVIAALHHEQDMRRTGGLATRLPRTAAAFFVAVLAISAAGVPWTPFGVGGFYSKEEILAAAWARTSHVGSSESPAAAAPGALFWLPLLVSYLTPLYMGRCFVLVFLGKPRHEQLHPHSREHPLMTAPQLALAALTLLSGWWLLRGLVTGAAPTEGLAPLVLSTDERLHTAHTWLPLLGGFAWLVGLGMAWLLYRSGQLVERPALARIARGVLEAIDQRFWIDELYHTLVVRPAGAIGTAARLVDAWLIDGIIHAAARLVRWVSALCGRVIDGLAIDGLVDGVARGAWRGGAAVAQIQTGLLRQYLLVMFTAVAAVLSAAWSGWIALGLVSVVLMLLTRQWSAAAVVALSALLISRGNLNPAAALALIAAGFIALIWLGRRARPALPMQAGEA